MSENLGTRKADEQVEDETPVTSFIRISDDGIGYILKKGYQLIVQTKHVELLEVRCANRGQEDCPTVVTVTASRMVAVAEKQLEGVAVKRHALIK